MCFAFENDYNTRLMLCTLHLKVIRKKNIVMHSDNAGFVISVSFKFEQSRSVHKKNHMVC